jgi:hypothetical protein
MRVENQTKISSLRRHEFMHRNLSQKCRSRIQSLCIVNMLGRVVFHWKVNSFCYGNFLKKRGSLLQYRNVTDPQHCIIESVHFNKANQFIILISSIYPPSNIQCFKTRCSTKLLKLQLAFSVIMGFYEIVMKWRFRRSVNSSIASSWLLSRENIILNWCKWVKTPPATEF